MKERGVPSPTPTASVVAAAPVRSFWEERWNPEAKTKILGGKVKTPRQRRGFSLFQTWPDQGCRSVFPALFGPVSSPISLSTSCFPSVFKQEWLPAKFSVTSLCNWLPFSSTETALPKVKTDILINQPTATFQTSSFPDLCETVDDADFPYSTETISLLRCWAWLAPGMSRSTCLSFRSLSSYCIHLFPHAPCFFLQHTYTAAFLSNSEWASIPCIPLVHLTVKE